MHPSSLLHRARRTVVGNEGHLKEILSTICLGVVKTDKPPYHAALLLRTHYLNTVLDFSLPLFTSKRKIGVCLALKVSIRFLIDAMCESHKEEILSDAHVPVPEA